MSQPILDQIDKVVKENNIVLFMKGTPEFPQCGFSQQVAGILNAYQIPFAAVNVLLDEAVRQGIKDYSDWPTIPQLYIGGEFVGGCDIVKEMQASGELAETLKPYLTA
ncbi:MAG: monothiol glutaredoxin, Grx4 family [Zetaproteobacteria bacterium CG_4_9_14_3_um_filter_49_83]|nr:MAG: monothiol glutaredoxin, Grx4 family [Zetaproteobacteria bacterium CG1_02_49_23]PIQ29968.1 MAG: monothiol glutaredoxin, Grx4 family [Zetaproteobacteria bacterium CG17_big_fil_post_rev_8_21_14_2_50_50_13]PIV31452.1 MAG: monothiol glutaredoxin, Grx4 family [Zetaproteobacteria bacterium CG02_land_8_20_14_3_00_50_9]PIY55047.1 MAG: monothiol glutaredoxin, Grx4 family [Zetaproteobacteria bacterium CG_4_10_14_0_8_um_filter_49_80]PJA36537.1 MAG: monothiol glutaredoxin, Grx4 family [Zetaproteobac